MMETTNIKLIASDVNLIIRFRLSGKYTSLCLLICSFRRILLYKVDKLHAYDVFVLHAPIVEYNCSKMHDRNFCLEKEGPDRCSRLDIFAELWWLPPLVLEPDIWGKVDYYSGN